LITVIGGMGTLGQPVVRELLASGFRVRVVTTQTGKARHRFGRRVEEVVADVTHAASLSEAVAGSFGVHINLQGGPSREDFFRIEAEGIRNIVKACQEANVEKLSYTSGMAVSRLQPTDLSDPDSIQYPAIAKYQAERAIMASGIDYTIFRPTSFIDTFQKFVRGRFAFLIGGFEGSFHWLCAREYAQYVVQSFERPECRNRIFPVLGPKKIPYRTARKVFFQHARPDVIPLLVPRWVLRGMALFIPPLRTALRMMKAADEFVEVEAAETVFVFGQPQLSISTYCKAFPSADPTRDMHSIPG
jgi:uncharacterized protein YbjT (DUF2867 family)